MIVIKCYDSLCQIEHKFFFKTESDNIISDHIEYVHQTLRFSFLI